MAQSWTPADIGPICRESHATLSQCSPAGFIYLALITKLFGGTSYSVSYPKENPHSKLTRNHYYYSPPSKVSSNILKGYPLSSYYPGYHFDSSPGLFNNYDVTTNHEKSSPILDFNNYQFKNIHPQFNYDYFKKTIDDSYTANSQGLPILGNYDYGKKASRRWKRQTNKEYDFIIVGAGSAGCVLANRLSEIKEWKILLLEAGPEEPDVTMVPSLPAALASSSIDWMYRTQQEKLTCRSHRGGTCAWIRGKTMGGCSAVNYLVYMRGNKGDYDAWSELGNNGWSYHEVLPYFKKIENNRDIEAYDTYYHSVGGPLNVERFSYTDSNTVMIVEALKETGLPMTDLNGKNNIGTNIAQSTSKDGRRVSANVAYIKPIRNKRTNLEIITNAHVTKVLINSKSKTAIGIEYVKNGAIKTVYARKEVILSAGAINSPKILMLSGIGPKKHLRSLNIPVLSDLKVGYNLQDHTTTEGLIFGLSNKTSTLVSDKYMTNELVKYKQMEHKKSGPLSTTSTLNAVGFIQTKYAPKNAPDIQFHFHGRNVKDFFADLPTYLATNAFPSAFYDGITPRPILLAPKSRGLILLNNTDPVFGQPLIYPGFFTVQEDVDVLIEGMRYAVNLEETEAFKSKGAKYIRKPVQGCEKHVWGSDEYFTCLLTEWTATIFHPSGTCKMGPKWDQDAVVDPRLRVYGINKLRVADASIMPLIVRGNTNVPTMMIGEKASDMIKEDWLS